MIETVEPEKKHGKPHLEAVKKLYDKIEEVGLHEEGFHSVDILKEMIQEYQNWVASSLEEL